jgi:multicomponent Na+:H+ antiporter subunit G
MITETLVIIFIIIGLFFNTLGVIGILRFPDVYTRLHAETKMTTFGTIFLGLGAIVYCAGAYLSSDGGQYIDLSVNVVIILFALAFTNATGSHAIARAAYRSGQKPAGAVVDKLSEAEK